MESTGDGKKETNQSQISVIIRTLAGTLVLCILGIFWLLYHDKPVPNELWLFAGQIFTALTAMLVKTTPTSSTQDVHVTNPPKDPVNTADQPQQPQPFQ